VFATTSGDDIDASLECSRAQLQTILDDLLKDAPVHDYESCATPAFIAPFVDTSDADTTTCTGGSLDTHEATTSSGEDDGLLARLIDECDLILEQCSDTDEDTSPISTDESIHKSDDCDILLDADLLDSSLFTDNHTQNSSQKTHFSLTDYPPTHLSSVDIPVWDQSMDLFDCD